MSTLFESKKLNGVVKYNDHTIEMNNSDSNTTDSQLTKKQRHRKKSPLIDRFFSSFSMAKNSAIITTKFLGSDSIEVIHGMRLMN